MRFFSLCINPTSMKYGLRNMEYFEDLVRLPEIETAFLFPKHEFKLKL